MDANVVATTVTETNSIFSVLSSIGLFSVIIPGLIALIASYIFDLFKNKANLRFEKLIEMKINRYDTLILFMEIIVDPKSIEHKHISILKLKDDGEVDEEFLKHEVITQRVSIQLIADKMVLEAVDRFIQNPTTIAFNSSLIAMRKDIWGK